MNIETPSIRFVGKIHSDLKNLENCPLQEYENAPVASVEISDEFQECIRNIAAGDEIVILTWLHVADRNVLSCIPRRNYGSPKIGVFSTRSPDRPNPIGLHSTKVISVTDKTIKVTNLEVLDGTPVIDIKPLLKSEHA